jgi:hypothetical protein
LETRNSHGLDQFCSVLEERPGLSILDFAAASQNTISFITGQGHRLCSDDFLLQLDTCFGEGDDAESQSDPFRVEDFLAGAFDFPNDSFDGALIWDNLEFLTPQLLARVMSRLHAILRPGAILLAMFHAQEHKQPIPSYSYRIQDRRTVVMTPRGNRKPASFFNNRNLEKLFENFQSVKFFLTRDALREVIVRR